MFTILHKDGKARVGRLTTKSGDIETPFFMPVATKGSVKYISSEDLQMMGNTAVISNAFVLYLRPGDAFFPKVGGIKQFMNYHGINVTDSGGFQMYKDTFLIKTTHEGVWFRSPFDGTKHFITPERDMDIQLNIGSDIAMCLDTMPLIGHTKKAIHDAITKTTSWAKRCYTYHTKKKSGQLLFAITQGGIHDDLRAESCTQLKDLPVDGFSIGGLALGEPAEDMLRMVDIHTSIMPENKPRYLMGVGSPIELLEAIERGVDMFDSRFPTQNARRGTLFTSSGKLRIMRKEYEHDTQPLDKACACFVCKTYSRAFIRYQLQQKEGTGYRLATYHQLYYLTKLMADARAAIQKGTFSDYKKHICATYAKEDKRISSEVQQRAATVAKRRKQRDAAYAKQKKNTNSSSKK